MKPVTKGLIKGGIQIIEFFQGLLLGFSVQKMYEIVDTKQNQIKKEKTQIEKVLDIVIYMFILISSALIVREFNILFSTKFIIKSMSYDKFNWPPPVILGFGLLFFQDSLKEKIKITLNLNEPEVPRVPLIYNQIEQS